MHSLFRVIKFALQKLVRNTWLSLVTITVLVLALLSVNFIIVFNYIAEQSVMSIKDKVDISINFKEQVTDVEIDNLQRFLSGLDIVDSVIYISPQQALETFKHRYQDSDELLSSLDELDTNPLPASLIVRAHNIEDYEQILTILSNDTYQSLIANTTFEDYRTLINKLHSIIFKVQRVGYGISLLFVLMSVLIIYNTVRINVYTYREEIGIMKLVGASNTFVRAPFILESVFLGILALIVIISIIYPVLNIIQPYLSVFFGAHFDLISYFHTNYMMIFGGQLLAVVVLNVIASGWAVGRYLKV